MDERDAERLKLLDRLAERVPGFDLGEHDIEWMTASNGTEVLCVDGGGADGGLGYQLSNAGQVVVFVGPLSPLINDFGSVVISPDGSWRIHRAVPDPLAGQKPD